MPTRKETRYIFVVDFVSEAVLLKYKEFARTLGIQERWAVRLVLLHSRKELSDSLKERAELFDEVLQIDFNKPSEVIDAVRPYEGKILCVTCRSESAIPDFAKFIPFVPYVRVPTSESLIWATNKIQMRRRFHAYNPKISPRYRIVEDSTQETIEKIENRLRYPIIVKPYGLAQSLLVTIVYHQDELRGALKRIFKNLSKVYEETEKKGEMGVLVEEFMEGEQYSIDAYVNSRGKIYFCPAVHIKTGKQVGFDDFFGYRQMTPTRLKKETEDGAQAASTDAIHALGLRSCTAHVELMRTEDGWKVIELGPRVGGFREELHEYSHGFHHSINDLLIRMGRKPIIYRTVKGHTAAIKLFSKKEGIITSLKGIKTMEKLDSFVKKMNARKKVGSLATFAKNGGKSIVDVLLFNEDRSQLLADIRRLENSFEVSVKRK